MATLFPEWGTSDILDNQGREMHTMIIIHTPLAIIYVNFLEVAHTLKLISHQQRMQFHLVSESQQL